VQLELQPRRHTEVAPRAAKSPQQLGILIRACADHHAVGSHELGTDEVVAGEAVLGGEMADSSAEGQPSDPGRANDAAGRDEPKALGRRVEIEPPRAAIDARGPRVAVEVHPAHQRQIDHQAAVADAVSGGVVPTSAYGDLQRVRPGEVKGPRHVAGIETSHDHGRPAVDQGVEAARAASNPASAGASTAPPTDRRNSVRSSPAPAGSIGSLMWTNTSLPGLAPGVCT
jgi:hypothetical protein